MYDEGLIPEGVASIVSALCADYYRRAEVIAFKKAPYNVIMEYRFLNYRMVNAAAEIAGMRDAERFIYDIGNNVGYATSELYALSEKVYKSRKSDVRLNIARRLSLV